MQLEEHLVADHCLDLRPRPHADLLDHCALLADEDLLLRLGLDEHVGAHDLLVHLLDLDRDRVRHLVPRELERLLAHELGDLEVQRQVGALLAAEVRRPLRQQGDELVAQLVDPVAGLCAHRVQREEPTQLGRGHHLGRDVTGLQPVDLVDRDHDRHAELEDALRDEAVASADPLACVDHEQHRVHVLERRVDGALHTLGERVARPLEAGQVRQDELPVVAVRDAEDAPPRGLRLVGDDRDLAAAQRVHECGLADVRAPGDRHEA